LTTLETREEGGRGRRRPGTSVFAGIPTTTLRLCPARRARGTCRRCPGKRRLSAVRLHRRRTDRKHCDSSAPRKQCVSQARHASCTCERISFFEIDFGQAPMGRRRQGCLGRGRRFEPSYNWRGAPGGENSLSSLLRKAQQHYRRHFGYWFSSVCSRLVPRPTIAGLW
jgi:hypothetical protein